MSNWYRSKNSFFILNQMSDETYRFVEFFNFNQWDDIARIYMQHSMSSRGHDIAVRIMCNARINNKLNRCIERFASREMENVIYSFEDYERIYHFKCYAFKFHSIGQFALLIKLMRFTNSYMEREIFSEDIIREFANINNFYNEVDDLLLDVHGYTHHIPSFHTHNETFVNPVREYSTELSEYLFARRLQGKFSDAEYKHVKYLLAHGEDPNQRMGLIEESPIQLAGWCGRNADERVYQVLLGYHADATLRKIGGFSALDIAMICCSDNLLKLITDSLSTAAQPPRYQINDIRILRMDDAIQTQFDLFMQGDVARKTVDTIVTNIKKMPDQTEEQAILDFSNKEFKLDNDPDQSRLTASIKKDLRKANSMTEIIRNGRGQWIGFNMFNLIETDEPDKLYVYCNLSFLVVEYRQTRIMPLLSWRVAIAVQGLNPDKTIIIDFLSIHPNSYRLVKNLPVVHWPMYKTHKLVCENNKLLEAIDIDPKTQFCHDDMVCYVKDQMQLREPYTPGSSFLFQLFSQHLGLASPGSTQFRAKPVMVPVSREFFCALEELCNSLNINLTLFLRLFIPYLQDFFTRYNMTSAPITTQCTIIPLYSARFLFWKDERILADKITIKQCCKL